MPPLYAIEGGLSMVYALGQPLIHGPRFRASASRPKSENSGLDHHKYLKINHLQVH